MIKICEAHEKYGSRNSVTVIMEDPIMTCPLCEAQYKVKQLLEEIELLDADTRHINKDWMYNFIGRDI